jgi:hypothetical protein
MWEVSDISCPDAIRIELTLDNPNADPPCREAFVTDEAQLLVNRFEYRQTPRDGSWPYMIEVELRVLTRPWLNG